MSIIIKSLRRGLFLVFISVLLTINIAYAPEENVAQELSAIRQTTNTYIRESLPTVSEISKEQALANSLLASLETRIGSQALSSTDAQSMIVDHFLPREAYTPDMYDLPEGPKAQDILTEIGLNLDLFYFRVALGSLRLMIERLGPSMTPETWASIFSESCKIAELYSGKEPGTQEARFVGGMRKLIFASATDRSMENNFDRGLELAQERAKGNGEENVLATFEAEVDWDEFDRRRGSPVDALAEELTDYVRSKLKDLFALIIENPGELRVTPESLSDELAGRVHDMVREFGADEAHFQSLLARLIDPYHDFGPLSILSEAQLEVLKKIGFNEGFYYELSVIKLLQQTVEVHDTSVDLWMSVFKYYHSRYGGEGEVKNVAEIEAFIRGACERAVPFNMVVAHFLLSNEEGIGETMRDLKGALEESGIKLDVREIVGERVETSRRAGKVAAAVGKRSSARAIGSQLLNMKVIEMLSQILERGGIPEEVRKAAREQLAELKRTGMDIKIREAAKRAKK